MWALLLIFTILTTSVQGYAIEGSWKVVDILDTTLPERYFIKAEIKNFIFRNTNIRWTLTFTGCQTFKYMMQIRDNNLYIDLNTLYIDNKGIENCSEQSIRYENQLRNAIKKTFSFKMVYFLMAFSNPENNPVIKFERINSNNTDRNKIQGAWMINRLFSRNMAEMIQIQNKKIIYCQKKAEVDFKQTNNKVQITGTRATSCRNIQIMNAFNGTLYFVKRNTTLQMYNPNDELIMSLTYITDIQGLKKMREQQQRNNPPPPPPPPMMRQNTFAPPSNRIPMPSAQVQYPVDKYYGKWSVTKILGQSNIPKKTQLVISNNTLIISNECVTYIQTYTKQSDAPFKIKRRTLRQMPSSCKNEDNSIYKNALTKTSLLKLSLEGNLMVVRTFDLTGKQMLTLTRNNDVLQPLLPPPPPPNLFANNFSPFPIPSSTQNDPNSLQQGKYTILLLMRRQIPRKIVNLKGNSFKVTLCNEYLVSLELNNKKEIKIRTQKTKQNSCDLTTQKLFLENFNNATTFNHDEQDTTILKDKNNNEIITLNLVG